MNSNNNTKAQKDKIKHCRETAISDQLKQFLENLNRVSTLQDIFNVTQKIVVTILKADRSAILWYQNDGRLCLQAWKSLSADFRKSLEEQGPWHSNKGDLKAHHYPDMATSGLNEAVKHAFTKEGINALYLLPMKTSEHFRGYLMFLYTHAYHCTSEQLEYANVIAQNVSVVLSRQIAFEETRELKLKYQSIFENSAEGIYQSTPEGQFITVNPAMVRMFGYRNEKEMLAIEKTSDLYWETYERERLAKMVNSKGVLVNIEVQMKRANGNPFWVLMNDRVVKDVHGDVLYYEGTLQDITDRKQTEDLLQRRDMILEAISYSAGRLLKTTAWEEEIDLVLKKLGSAVDVSRVYIFENHRDSKGKWFTSQRFEWAAEGIAPQIHEPQLQNLPFVEAGFERWIHTMLEDEQIQGLVKDFPEQERAILSPQEIYSILVIPIFVEDEWWGFIGFDDCHQEREWTHTEVDLLKTIARILGDAIHNKKSRERIRESEHRLRSLINATPDIICFKDGEGRWLEANDAILERFSLGKVAYQGKTDQELAQYTDPVYREALLLSTEQDERTWQSRKVSRSEEKIKQPDRSEKIFDVIRAPGFDADHNRKNLVVLGRDITDRKKAEQTVYKQLNFSQTLNKVAEHLIQYDDLQKILNMVVRTAGKALQLDRCLIYFLDFQKQEAVYLSKWNKFDHISSTFPDERLTFDSIKESIKHFTEHRSWIESHINKIHPILISDGWDETVHVRLNIKSIICFPFAFTEEGFYIIALGHLQQVHNWRKEEITFIESLTWQVEIAIMKMRFLKEKETAAQQLQRLAMLVDQASESIVITDVKGEIEYVNPAFEAISGYRSHEILGDTPARIKSGKHDSDFYKNLWTTINRGEAWNGKFINLRKDGSYFAEEAVIFPIKNDSGYIINFCKIGRDVSREEELERQLEQSQKMEAIGTLAGGVAHDFNNLLTVINGYAEMALMKAEKGSSLHKNLISILKAGKSAEGLTRQLLAFSRKQIYEPKILNINEIITSMDKMMRRLLGEDIQIETNLTTDTPNIKADPAQIEQILTNLIINARDAVNTVSKPGFKKIILIETGATHLDEAYVDRHTGSDVGPHVFFSVSDNGIGMDKSIQDKVFDPFFTTKTKNKGTGLGLSMVYGIVKQNKGNIQVYSEPNEGTMFKIYWPVNTEGIIKQETVTDERNLYGSERILLVEDETEVRDFAASALEALGYQIHKAANGHEALEMLTEGNLDIDLLVTDLVMPEMNGKELADEIIKLNPETKTIFVSGYTDTHVVVNGSLKEGVHFVQKPYSQKKLARVVRCVLDEKDHSSN